MDQQQPGSRWPYSPHVWPTVDMKQMCGSAAGGLARSRLSRSSDMPAGLSASFLSSHIELLPTGLGQIRRPNQADNRSFQS